MTRWFFAIFVASVCFALAPIHTEANGDDREVFFETKIRPILERACIECHRGDDAQGGLRWTDRSGWEAAGVIEPGRPEASSLIDAVRSTDPATRMPPPDSGKSLSATDIAALERWIREGAFDPRTFDPSPSNSTGPKKRNRRFEITPEDESYWAFQPIVAPEFSPDEQSLTASEKLDVLVRRGLRDVPGLDLAPLASPRELARRASFDLWGLPPDPSAIERLENDPSLGPWQTWIDELLASHHFGERWGRHWLDWVRFAETNGYERDGLKPHAWRYRDYVIDSIAKDKPYDAFILEQLAGDEWAEENGWSPTHEPERWREAIIATGFYRLHVWDDEPDDSQAATFDDADDVMVSIGAAFLGVTVGCARCHDHKFDPISQRDYYSMLSFLRGIDPYGLTKSGGGGRGTGRIQRFLVSEDVSAAWEAERQQKIAEAQRRLEQATDPAVRLQIDGEIKSLRDSVPPFDAALAVADIGPSIAPTFVLHRGDVHSPRDPVEPDVPGIFKKQIDAPEYPGPGKHSSGRRLQLAKWIAHPNHPLTARVLVNRIWQRYFGVGIVPTPDDFGRTGMPPSNLPLLDFLARELIDSGWSMRHVHRVILSSHAYRMRSQTNDPQAELADPEVHRFWRQRVRRLDAEAIRDSILWMSGSLGEKRSGPSVYPTLTPEVRDSANPVSLAQWVDSPPGDQNCRSVYLIVKRSLKVPFLETLDFANSTSPVGVRSVTTTAPQALLLLNDPWLHAQASKLLERALRESPATDAALLERLWSIVYQRRPSELELQHSLDFLQSQSATALATASSSEEKTIHGMSRHAWQSLVRALLNSNEAIYVE
ncbi:MAG: PSD1 and planctomycete cytochrome C domain-containing protein [Pirellula sp.]